MVYVYSNLFILHQIRTMVINYNYLFLYVFMYRAIHHEYSSPFINLKSTRLKVSLLHIIYFIETRYNRHHRDRDYDR